MPSEVCQQALTTAPVLLAATGLAAQRGGRWLFSGLDLALHVGEVVAITGPSGAGKSTLLGILAGLQAAQVGTVTRRCRVALALQDPGLPGDLTLRDAVRCGALPGRSWSSWWRLSAVDRATAELSALGLGDLGQRKVRHASGGERQRAALARALLGDAPVLLADEPVANLDPAAADLAMSRIQSAARAGRAVAVVLHQPELVARWCDREVQIG